MRHNKKRQERLRHMVRELNRDRKRRAEKVDILCHDLVDAQRNLISRLDTISFAASFYRSLLGLSDLSQMLRAASAHIGERVPQVSVAFFLMGSEGCKEVRYAAPTLVESRLASLLDESVRQAICRANRINSLEELLALGLQVNAGVRERLSLATIPLAVGCRPLGFVFLHREGDDALRIEDLKEVAALCPGLSEAISAIQRLPRFA